MTDHEFVDEAARLPPEAFPNSGDPVFLTTTREAQEALSTRRRHIFRPIEDRNGRIYAYDSLCGRRNAPIGLRGNALEPVPPKELLFSHLVGGDRVCDSCRKKASLERYVAQEDMEAFIQVDEFPEEIADLHGEENAIEVVYEATLETETTLPDGWWTNQLGHWLDREFDRVDADDTAEE